MTHWHIVGICGIGMSALAQFAAAMNIKVSGSDRALENPENALLKQRLQRQNIHLFPQDGSRFKSSLPPVDAVIYSSAIEESNPEFAAAGNIPRIHRATALKELILRRSADGKPSVAVAGSCGKTSTSAMIAEAMYNLKTDVECINGGMIKRFADDIYPGNYRHGSAAVVFEADESDKSLLEFHPDYAVVLNIGTDHYPKAELAEMFAQFVNQAQKAAVLQDEVYALIKDKVRTNLPISTFGISDSCRWQVSSYQCFNGKSHACFNGGNDLYELPSAGLHTAMNCAAAAALLELMNNDHRAALQAVLNTHGTARRFDFHGRTVNGAAVYDDYAHNPEKIANIIAAAQELTGSSGRVLVYFQPHGYGPFGFMRDELGRVLAEKLRADDRFYLAEPFYAGGTSSFSPNAGEVIASWLEEYDFLNVCLAPPRSELKAELIELAQSSDLILIMGARDNSLVNYAQEFAAERS
ncbi:MAG: hypothetical protein E7056_06995 [Lentisphaerae bacterium]|nr:hypothetical protein [Lentisphaerota bacterium]